MKKLMSCLLALFSLYTLTFAQTTISGRIIDAQTKEPLAGVNILISNSSQGSTSLSNGSFVLKTDQSVPEIAVSFVGYKTKTLSTSGQNMLISLEPSSLQLNQIVVSASREGESRTEAPVAISTISRELITQTKAVSLDQLLNKVSGVYMVNLGNEQHSMAIRQPIGTKSLYLYLEDGVPIRTTGDFNHNALIEINMAALKNIEVIRGPSSSLYGSEAIGGAINFITQAPSLLPTAKLQLEMSNRGYRRTDFSASTTIGKVGIFAGGYYTGQRKGYFSHSDFDKLALTFRLDYLINEKSKLITTASLIDYITDQTGGLDSANFYGKQYSSLHTFSYRKVKALRIKSTFDHTWNKNNSSKITAFFRHNSIGQNPFYAIRNVQGNPLKARGEINDDAFDSYGLIAQHRKSFPFWKGRLIVGVSADYSPASYIASFIDVDRNADGVYTGFTKTDSLLTDYSVNLLNTAVYGQLELSPMEALKIVGALRYDRLDYRFDNNLAPSAFTGAPDETNHFANLTPKLGLTYDFGKDKGMYANYSVGFAPPQITDLYRGVKVPTLKPAYFNNYEVGGWLNLMQGKGYLDISFYQMDGRNEIVSVRLPDGSYENQNAGKTRHRGVEYTIKYAPVESVSLRFSGTNARHTFVQYIERGADYTDKTMNTAPEFMANAEVIYKPAFLKGLRLSAEWQRIGKFYMDAANTEQYNGYHLFNTRVGYTWKGAELWINAINLTNELYATTVDKTAFGKSYRQGIPRTFNIGIAYNFTGKSN
ncbi:TonB-dependent receptor [Rhodocytophaga rosea]|uniref:TonB-dependent receptor n=1 Tax=Rhodocytophaga rosea TaxID=2704465 RepID=A0A6C0GID0_9BACT|nr:TonB-dependent receptor [Rhodocytophaga rosea]QHT67697.1 TonB-dependent receptor [Rhodocytophaga rosea]